jgi:phosphoglycolate phosphatase
VVKLIIFDMDGTILDSSVDINDSLNHTLTKYNEEEVSVKRTIKTLGYGARYLLEKNFFHSQVSEEILNDYLTYYNNHLIVKSTYYEGTLETIRYIKSLGIKVAVASNKSDFMVKHISKTMFLDLFDYAIGESESIRKKPNPDMVNTIINFFQINHNETIYIGDTEVDYLTSKNSNVNFIGCSYGFRSKYQLKKLGDFKIINKISNLKKILGEKHE